MTVEKERPEADMEEPEGAGNEDESEVLMQEAESGEETTGKLEQALAAREEEITGLKYSLNELRTESDRLGEALAHAVGAYREIALQANPGVPEEFIRGNTVDEINEALKNTRVLLDKVRQEIEMEHTRSRIPAGAPSRMATDVSSLSPREKIQRALGSLPS